MLTSRIEIRSESYLRLTSVLLRATPAASFSRWEGCDQVIDVNFCEVSMTQARHVIAEFVPP